MWGKAGNTATLNVNASRTFAGHITLYGGEINLAANLTATGAGSTITLTSAGGSTLKTTFNTTSVLTAPGGITINSDYFAWSGAAPHINCDGRKQPGKNERPD